VHGERARDVYLPEGASWLDAWTGAPVKGNGWTTAEAPLERIPVYLRQGGALNTLSSGGRSQERGRPDIDVLATEEPT
jgi:alpha-D-xyloside xylohydrolase